MAELNEPIEVKVPNVRFGTTFLDVDYRDKAAKDEVMLNKRTGQIVYQRKDGSFLWFSRESIPTYEYFSQIKNKIIRTSTWRSPIENRAKFKETYFLSYITNVIDYKWDTELEETAAEGEEEPTPLANPAYVFGNKKINPEQIAYSISQEANGFFINLGITPRDRALIGVLTSAYNHAYANYDGEDEELLKKAEKFNEYNFMESHFTITYTVTWYDGEGNVVDTETSEAHVCAGENSMVRFTKRYTYERATVNRTTLVIHDISAPKLAGGYELMHQAADTEEFLETVMDSPYIATDDMIVSYFFTQTDPDICMADEASHTDYIFALGMDEYEATLSRAGYEIPTNGVTISIEEPTKSIWGNTQIWYETIRKVNDMDNIEFIGTGETTPEILEEMIKNVTRRRTYFTKDAGDVTGFLFKPIEGGSLRPIDPPITDKRFVDQFKIDLHTNTVVVTTQNPATSKTLDLSLMPEDQTLVNLLVTKLQAVEELELSNVDIETLFVNPIFRMVQIGTSKTRGGIVFSTADEDEMNMIIDQLCKDFLEWIFIVPPQDTATKHLDAFEVSYTQGEVEVTVEIPPIDETEEATTFTKVLKMENLTEDSSRVLASLKIESAKIAVIDASDIIVISYDAVDPVTLIDTGIIRVYTKSSITTPAMKIFVGQQSMAYRNLVNSVLRDLTEEAPNEPDPIIPEKPKRLVTYNITSGDVSLEIEETAITKVIEAAKIPESLLEKLNALRQVVYEENYVDDGTKLLVTKMELDAANETIRIFIEDTAEAIVDASYTDDIDRNSEVETIITEILNYEDPEEPWDFKDTGLDQYYIDLLAATVRISARGATIVKELGFSDLDEDSMTLVGELAEQVCEASELITDSCPLGKLLVNPIFNAMRVVLAGETEANIFSLSSHPAIAETVTKLTDALYYLLFPDERPIPVIDSYITSITVDQAIAVAAYAEEKLQDEWNFTPSNFSVDFQTQLTDLIDRVKMSEMLSLPEDANVTHFIIYSTKDIMDVFCDADDLTRYLPFGANENIQTAATAVREEILKKVTTTEEPTPPDPETPDPTPEEPDPTPEEGDEADAEIIL